MLEVVSNQLFKVLDITKTGLFKKSDLQMFLGFLITELELQGIGQMSDENIDAILKSVGVHDMNKMNQKHLD
jgi:hypothetical protein